MTTMCDAQSLLLHRSLAACSVMQSLGQQAQLHTAEFVGGNSAVQGACCCMMFQLISLPVSGVVLVRAAVLQTAAI